MLDPNHAQIEDNGTTPDNDGEDCISDDQDTNIATQDDQTYRAFKDNNYCTAIDNDDLEDTVQFSNPVTQLFLSRSVRVPMIEVTGANKGMVENPIEAPNTEEGARKTITGGNTKANMGNITPPMEAITTIIITVIIKVEVDMAMEVIITEVVATVEAVIKAITIISTTNITHMMMAYRWSNTAHHVHFVVVLITLLNTVLRESMT